MSNPFHDVCLTVRTLGDVNIVRFVGDDVVLNEDSADGLGERVLALVRQPHPCHTIFNFGGVAYMSSRALSELIGLNRKLKAAGGSLAVRNVSPLLYELLAVTRLTTFLDIRQRAEGTRANGAGQPDERPAGILIVDDEDLVRNTLGAGLRAYGFTVWLAATGADGVELYREHRNAIGVALVDMRMQGLDGPATLAALRAVNPGLCCCLMGGDLVPGQEKELARLGAARVFRKPFALAQVARSLRAVMRGSAPSP